MGFGGRTSAGDAPRVWCEWQRVIGVLSERDGDLSQDGLEALESDLQGRGLHWVSEQAKTGIQPNIIYRWYALKVGDMVGSTKRRKVKREAQQTAGAHQGCSWNILFCTRVSY